MPETKYPENEKLKGVLKERNSIVEFMEWLESNNMAICTFDPKAWGGAGNYDRARESFEKIAHRHLGIDSDALEKERQAMVEKLQEAIHGK